MPEQLPQTEQYSDLKRAAESLDPNWPAQIDSALSKSKLDEDVTLQELQKIDPTFVEQWYDTFLTDLQEAAKEQIGSVQKLQDGTSRIQNTISNKLKELGNKYLAEANKDDAKTKGDKVMTEQLRPMYQNVRQYMAAFSALGVNPGALQSLEQLCREEKQPTLEHLRQMQNFQSSTLVVGSCRALMQSLSHLAEKSGNSIIRGLALEKSARIEELTKAFLENPLESDRLAGGLQGLQQELSTLQELFKNILREQLAAQRRQQKENEIDPAWQTFKDTTKMTLDVIGNICIPFYSTAGELYKSYQTGQVDKAALAKALAFDALFFLPGAKALGMTVKIGAKAVEKGAKVAKAARVAKTFEKVADAGSDLAKMAHESKAYTALNVAGTAGVMLDSAHELYQQLFARHPEAVSELQKQSGKKDMSAEDVLKIGLSAGYLVLESATAKYTLNKNLQGGTKKILLRFFEDYVESSRELDAKRA